MLALSPELMTGLYGRWLGTTRFPGLIASVALVDRPGDEPVVTRFSHDGIGFIADTSDTLAIPPEARPQDDEEKLFRIVADSNRLSLVMPIVRYFEPEEPAERVEREKHKIFLGTLVIELDRDYFARQMVADLFRRYLGSERQRFLFALVDDGNREILSTSPDSGLSEVDAAVSRDVDRIVPLTELAGMKESLLGLVPIFGEEDSRRLSSLPIEELIAYQWQILVDKDAEQERSSREVTERLASADQRAGISLYIWHEAGSLMRAATISRNRRLAFAYGVLLYAGLSGPVKRNQLESIGPGQPRTSCCLPLPVHTTWSSHRSCPVGLASLFR